MNTEVFIRSLIDLICLLLDSDLLVTIIFVLSLIVLAKLRELKQRRGINPLVWHAYDSLFKWLRGNLLILMVNMPALVALEFSEELEKYVNDFTNRFSPDRRSHLKVDDRDRAKPSAV